MYERWLFAEHPRRELAAWAGRLDWFRFVRAVGPDDQDRLVAVSEPGADAAAAAAAEVGPLLDGDATAVVEGDRLLVHVGGSHGVSGEDVARAVAIEAAVGEAVRAAAVDPPVDEQRCVSPRWHPDLFAAGAGRRTGGR